MHACILYLISRSIKKFSAKRWCGPTVHNTLNHNSYQTVNLALTSLSWTKYKILFVNNKIITYKASFSIITFAFFSSLLVKTTRSLWSKHDQPRSSDDFFFSKCELKMYHLVAQGELTFTESKNFLMMTLITEIWKIRLIF